MKSTWKIYGSAIKAAATLSVITALLSLPYLNYSKAHLHFFYGAVVAHWHQDIGLSKAPSDPKAPVAGHNHSLSDLFNLWNIDKNQSDPVVQQQPPVVYTFESKISAADQLDPGSTYLRSPSGRSPPASFVVL